MSYIGKIITFIPFFWLQIIPLCTVITLYLFSFASRKKGVIVWLLSLTVTLACAFISLHEEGSASTAFQYGALLAAFVILLLPVLRFNVGKKEGTKQTKSVSEEIKPLPIPPAPKAIITQESTSMPVKTAINGSVQLAHVFQVLKKLQSVKLSAGDRLETDVIQNMLTVYQAKETLSAEETRALNNYLATLLKLMSKYSL